MTVCMAYLRLVVCLRGNLMSTYRGMILLQLDSYVQGLQILKRRRDVVFAQAVSCMTSNSVVNQRYPVEHLAYALLDAGCALFGVNVQPSLHAVVILSLN